VRVADGFGPGRVKVTMSFADWKEGKVATAAYEIPAPGPAK
jgi:hypothetical protein